MVASIAAEHPLVSRREFLRIALAAAGAAALGACKIKLREVPTPPGEKGELYDDVVSYYPELSKMTIFHRGMFAVGQTLHTWYNFSNSTFDPEAAAGIYSFFETLAKSQAVLDYRLGSEIIPFILSPRTRRDRVIFIVPPEAPSPNWPNLGSSTAATTGGVNPTLFLTFVRIPAAGTLPKSQLFTSPNAAAARSFLTEACQSSIGVRSATPDLANLGQELSCNSLGYMLGARRIGVPYSEYQRIGLLTTIGPDPKTRYPLIVFGEEFYNQLPVLTPLK